MIHAGSCPRIRRPALFFSGEPGKKPEDCKDLEETEDWDYEKQEFLRLVPENFQCGKCTERPEESAAQQGGFRDPPPRCRSPPFVSCIEEEYGSVHEKKEQYQNFNIDTSRHTR